MKLLERVFYITCFIIFINKISLGAVSVSKFEIPSNYLVNGNQVLVSNSNPTNVNASITFVRSYYSGNIPEEVSLRVNVAYRPPTGGTIYLMPEFSVTNSDFGDALFYDKQILFTIPAGNAGGSISLEVWDLKASKYLYIPNWYSTTLNGLPSPSSRFLADMVGIDIGSDDRVYYWDFKGNVSSGTSTSMQFYSAPSTFTLPPNKSFTDIVSTATSKAGWHYTWFEDGYMSVGSINDLDAYIAPKIYSLPQGKTPSDIVGVSILKSNDFCYVWYKDGTGSIGNSTNLGAYTTSFTYTIAPGLGFNDIAEIGFAGSTGYCYVWYKDGTMSVGSTAYDLDSFIARKSMQ